MKDISTHISALGKSVVSLGFDPYRSLPQGEILRIIHHARERLREIGLGENPALLKPAGRAQRELGKAEEMVDAGNLPLVGQLANAALRDFLFSLAECTAKEGIQPKSEAVSGKWGGCGRSVPSWGRCSNSPLPIGCSG